jgi:hypothetical protein
MTGAQEDTHMTNQSSHTQKPPRFPKLDRVIRRQRTAMYGSALVMVTLLAGTALLATPLAA